MFRLSFFFFICAMVPAMPLSAQNTVQTVRGVVVDEKTSEPLIGASVVVVDENPVKGDVTDVDGTFKIENVSIGNHTIKVTFLGYEEKIITGVNVTAEAEVVLTIQLQESLARLDEVVVTGKVAEDNEPINVMAMTSARSFTIEETERYAAGLRDPSRLALSYAGVRGQSDILNGIIVRGNAPKGVMWRIDGVEVYSPNHFSQEGYGGGAVCMISGQAIGTSDFYTGAFPAEFGNAMSAVFDIRLRKGDTDKRRYYLNVGMMGLEGGMEGPFTDNKRASYLVNYRYSTLAVFEKIGFDIGNTISAYQDLNFKLNFPTKKAGTFSVFGLGGMSKLTISEGRRKKTVEKIKTYDMAVVGISHSYSLNEKNVLKSILSVSANRESLDKDEVFYIGSMLVPSYRMGASNVFARGSVQLDTRFSSRGTLRSGAVVSSLRFKLDDVFGVYKTDEYKSADLSYLLQGYSQMKYSLTEKFTLLAGFHVLYFGYNHNYSIEPRAGVHWQINKRQSLQFATGLHSKMETFATYMVENPWIGEQPNRELDFTKAVHVVLGYEIVPIEHLKLKAEAYYQFMYDVPISTDEGSYFSMLNFQDRYTTMELVNDGYGINYGIELTLEKSFAHNYYVLANGSLFNSKYYAADGVWRNSRYNSNYVTSLTAGKDFPFGKIRKSWTFGLNARVLWSGGERIEAAFFEEQVGDYFRLDTRVSLSRSRERVKWMLAFDIQNTTNRENENTLDEIDPVGILPVLSFRVELN